MSSSNAFDHIGATPVESLNLVVQHFEHKKTGAVHYHLETDNDEKAFMVAVRTMPKDSTGVAHILEHTVLCGSEKYPVRDPFFMMTRRSLNTFMNAMTSSDWTAYPFASQNDKDFNNLLDVYLDAVFFARLHPLDFAQEGHRVELEDTERADTPLTFKGVVYNEMKGAMSSPVARLWQGVSSYLFPTTTYHFNSGGEPAEITHLSYEQLMAFYRSHYHPSNAVFMTFGNLDVAELHTRLDEQALSRFEKQNQRWAVPAEQRYPAPVTVVERYAVEGEDLTGKTHHVMGWLLGESTDLDAQLEAQLVSQILLDNSAAPLRKALETTDLGTAVSPICGLEDSNHEMSFLCGLEGSDPEKAEEVEALVLSVFEQVAREGVDAEQVAAALHQLELHQREIGGDNYPYGLQLIFNALPAATHYGDPVAMLNMEPAIQRLKEKALAPDFMQTAVQRLLLDNRHRVRYSLVPDAGLTEESNRLERARLADIKASLSEEQLEAIKQQALDLKERQSQQDDPGLLPQVTLQDVRPEISYVAPTHVHESGLKTSEYLAGTNGILYQQLIASLPDLDQQQMPWLPFFTHAWTEVGAGGNDYLRQQMKQTSLVGSLTSYASIRGRVDDCTRLTGHLVLTGKALASNAVPFTELMKETWQQADFSEQARLLDLLSQQQARREHSITGSGHTFAMAAAAAGINRSAAVQNALSGMPYLVGLKQRLEQAKTDGGASIVVAMQAIYEQLNASPEQGLVVQDAANQQVHLDAVAANWADSQAIREADLGFQPLSPADYWMVDSQVNFCAWALPSVTMNHEDAAALSVLAGVLRNGYLHTAIREQGGAYGAGAMQDSANGNFRFYSYRDPRVEGTFEDFSASINWVLEQSQGDELVEQAILGLIGGMDRPGSPAGEAKQAFHMDLGGRTKALRQAFRSRLIQTKWQDVQRVASQYLVGQTGARGVIAPRGTESTAAALGMQAQDY